MSDTSDNLFIKASRRKLRFPTQGQVATEDLWDLSLESLNDCAIRVHGEIAPAEINFLEKSDRRKDQSRKDNELRLEILKFVIATKQDEAKERKDRADRKAALATLLEVRDRKAANKLEGMSLTNLDKQIAELQGAVAEDED